MTGESPAAAGLDFSGVVPCYNEAHLLPRCLGRLAFCREVIVVDQGSTDDSVAVAERLGARVLTHPLDRFPNLARQHGINRAIHEWVITVDPDELFPVAEVGRIEKLLRQRPELVGVRLPWRFFFAGRPLDCTVWGRQQSSKCAIVHRDRARGSPFVHKEFLDDPGIFRFPPGEIAPLEHYWANSYAEVIAKRRRYLPAEGERRYVDGDRFTWRGALLATARAAKANLIDFQALAGGPTGWALSAIHIWYIFRRCLELRRYEKGLLRQAPGTSEGS